MNRYISDILGISRGHAGIPFIDVNLTHDTRLFFDPVLIKLGQDSWHNEATNKIQSYFDELFTAYKTGDIDRENKLCEHAREVSATRLGYSTGTYGRAKTTNGMCDVLSPLRRLALIIPNMRNPEDIVLTIKGYDCDCLSDLLTNINHDILHRFTAQQMEFRNIEPVDQGYYYFWNAASASWEKGKKWIWRNREDNKEVLLTPKSFVRSRYLFGVESYLRFAVVDSLRRVNGWDDLSRKEILQNMQDDEANWRYRYALDHLAKFPESLNDFHENTLRKYNQGRFNMTDDELDEIVYENP